MKLNVRSWGTGDRVALLMHGITGSSRSWEEIGTRFAARGFHVVAPDFRGHGDSPRAPRYAVEEIADDVLETVRGPVQVAIGNSLGGWVLAKIADRLRPARTVYEDPAWAIAGAHHDLVAAELRGALVADAAAVRAGKPTWSDDEVERTLEARARFDPDVLAYLLSGRGYDDRPRHATVPSLVIAADPPDLITPAVASKLREHGFDVAMIPGASHTAHRDDPDGFMRLIESWLAKREGEQWFPDDWAARYSGDPGLWLRRHAAR